MIAEKSNTAQQIIERISAASPKVNFVRDEVLARALMYLETKGIPGSRHEDYKYCNLDAILRKEFRDIRQELLPVSDISALRLEDTITLVVVNGRYSAQLSDKLILGGLQLRTFEDAGNGQAIIGSIADVESDAFIALNTAFASGGFHLTVESEASLQIPLHILYISSAASESVVNPRNVIEIREGASAIIIEEQVVLGDAKVFTNFLSEKFVAANASLESYTIQNEGRTGYSVNTNQVKVAQGGRYENTTVTLSGQVVRNNHNVVLAGSASEAHLNGLFSIKDNQLVDNHTLMDHQVAHCESNELYKGIINDKATGVFNGKIFVRRDAQKTNAYQSSKNILLSDDGTINTKPQLEIYADDVKCSHGTSTGRIDENALFYLNARGIGKESARKMLLSSFADEVIGRIGVDSLKERVSNLFEKDR